MQRETRAGAVTPRDEALASDRRTHVDPRQRLCDRTERHRAHFAFDASLATRLGLLRPVRKLAFDRRNACRRVPQAAALRDDRVDCEPVRSRHAVALARLLLERGESEAARDALRPAAEASGTDTALLFAVLLEELGDLEGAEVAYREAAERGIGIAAFKLGRLLEAQGRREEAERAFAAAEALEGAEREQEDAADPGRYPDDEDEE